MTGRKRRGGPRFSPPPQFDDGLDPRSISDRRQPPRGGRKALQLCRQVQRALGYALSECGDPIAGASVWAVEPAPNASRLLVTLDPGAGEPALGPLMAALHVSAGAIRTRMAAAICRRKAPELIFRVLAASQLSPGASRLNEVGPAGIAPRSE